MDLKEMYDEIGGNYNEAKSRLMNDALIEKFALKYEADGTFEELKQAVLEKIAISPVHPILSSL